MLLLSQLFLPAFKSSQGITFSLWKMSQFHSQSHREMFRISTLPGPQTELYQLQFSRLLQWILFNTQLSSLTSYFPFQRRPQKQLTSATPIMPYERTSWEWFGMNLAGFSKTGSNDWNPSMRHQCCLWTREWTLGLIFFLDIL